MINQLLFIANSVIWQHIIWWRKKHTHSRLNNWIYYWIIRRASYLVDFHRNHETLPKVLFNVLLYLFPYIHIYLILLYTYIYTYIYVYIYIYIYIYVCVCVCVCVCVYMCVYIYIWFYLFFLGIWCLVIVTFKFTIIICIERNSL